MATKKKSSAKAPAQTAPRGSTMLERYGVWIVGMAVVAILLGASFFTPDGIVLNWLKAGASALIGRGCYLLPFALIAGAVRLCVPHKRGQKPSMALQMLGIFLVCFFAGLCAHLFSARGGDMALSVPGQFFEGAKEGVAAGFLTGGAGEVLDRLITIHPARILAILLGIISLLYACGITIGEALGWCIRYFRVMAANARTRAEAARLRREEEEAVAAAEEAERAKAEEPTVPVSDYGAAYAKPHIDVALDAPRRGGKKSAAPVPEATPAPVAPAPAAEEPMPDQLTLDTAAETVPEKATRQEISREIANIAREAEEKKAPVNYTYPPIELVGNDHVNLNLGSEAETRAGAAKLSETLRSFGVEAHIINVTHGPTITRYELQLDSGIRLSKVQNLSNDIAIAMGAAAVRIVLIPDRSAVGIEVPNRETSSVYLRDVLESREFTDSKSRITVCLGMDITGKPVTWDISKLPHLLVAGTTGSGKSVCINSFLISLLYKATPEEVRLIMVDPKMVELNVYNNIPHLLIPVVTDPKKAAGALQWAVLEMMSRYKRFSEIGVRNIFEYNDEVVKRNRAAEEELANRPEGDESDPPLMMEKIPHTVIVIDELADLMLIAKNDVEEAICHIAQMGRAAGMYLIVATQRPSADVITGLMKANIPSRIAFAVASGMESRIILDTVGAEQLVGKGDMLFNPIGAAKPMRIQGCFVASEQVEAVTDFVRAHAGEGSNYDEDVIRQVEQAAEGGDKKAAGETDDRGDPAGEEDELLSQAIELIVNSGNASTSMLQRRLGVGHARAGRLIDQMEDRGIVGPFAGSKMREVLMTKEEWQEIRLRNESIDAENGME